MKCPSCLQQVRAGAKFCGVCGAGLPVAVEPAALPPISVLRADARPLEASLYNLSAYLQKMESIPPMLRLAAQKAAQGAEQSHSLVVLGGHRSGKSTLINQMLGMNLVPTGRLGLPTILRLGFAEQWTGVPAATIVPAEPPAFTPETVGDSSRFCGPIPLLRGWEIVDTPGLNSLNEELERWAVREALGADAIVFCLPAHQLLSEMEQEMITRDILPLTNCPITLAVTYLDRVDSAEDFAELEHRIRRFIATAGPERLRLWMPHSLANPKPHPSVVLAIATEGTSADDPRALWRERVGKLLDALDELVAEFEPGDGKDSDPEELEKRREWLLCLLRREHKMAKDEACGQLRGDLGRIKVDVTTLVRSLPQKSVMREGRAHLEGRLNEAGKRAAELYLRRFHEGLSLHSPAELAAASAQIDRDANLHIHHGKAGPVPRLQPRREKRDWRSASLAGAGMVLATFSGGWVRLVGPAITLVASEQLRRSKQRQFEQFERAETTEMLKHWISQIEDVLVQKLSETVDPVAQQLETSVTAHVKASSMPPVTQTVPLRTLVLRCRECLADEVIH